MARRPVDTESPDFLLFYSRTLFREYCIRKRGPFGKQSWRSLLEWSYRAKRRYWRALEAGQGELFA